MGIFECAVRLIVVPCPEHCLVPSQGKDYTEVENIQAYIPSISIPTLAYPLLATDISTLEHEHISWTGDFELYNLCSVSLRLMTALDWCRVQACN